MNYYYAVRTKNKWVLTTFDNVSKRYKNCLSQPIEFINEKMAKKEVSKLNDLDMQIIEGKKVLLRR